MRARGIGIPAAAVSVILLSFAFAAFANHPLCAQQPATTGSASPSPALPPEAQAKLDKLRADLKAAQDKGNTQTQAETLNGIADLYFGVSAYQQALDNYNHALTLARASKDAPNEAAALNGIGGCFRQQGQNQKALEPYQQALDLATASGDLRGQAAALNGIGWVNENLGETQKSLDYQNKALPLAQKANDEGLEAAILRRIGYAEGVLGEPQKALDSYNKALGINRRLGDRDAQARVLLNIGILFHGQSEEQKALDYYEQAIPILRQVGNRAIEAMTLSFTGIAYYRLSETEKALDSFNEALSVFRELGDRASEGRMLNDIAVVYRDTGELRKALDNYSQALLIFRQLGNRHDEAAALSNSGIVYDDLGQPEKALDAYTQALAIRRQIGDLDGEAATLDEIGIAYLRLGEPNKTIEYDNQALPLYRQVGDRDGEAKLLTNVGLAHFSLGQYQNALDSFSQQLAICRELGNRDVEAKALGNSGTVYEKMGEPQKALDVSHQAELIYHEVGDRSGEAEMLKNIGNSYDDLGDLNKALDSYMQALPLATAVGDPLAEADIFYSLMLNRRRQQPALAVFYGKQAVNFVQQVRSNTQSLDKELQKSFLATVNDCYHDLADLLINQGRLPEAQQVLDLLKQQEYLDYVRGETANTLSPLALTPAEKQAEEDYAKSAGQIVALGEQWAALKKIVTRSPEQEQQYQQLSDQMNAASKGLNDYYTRLFTLFGATSDANKQVANVKGDVSLLKQTIAKMPHTTALYTLVSSERYSVIVITGSTAVAREYATPENDLNQKVAAFQQALRDPQSNAQPLAQELYKILIGPVRADLDQAQAQTLVWSLDGVLRYVPMAALFDGKHYLVEKYATVTITPVSIPHLAEKPDFNHLSAAAMGISRKYEDGLPALPAVVGELDEVVNDAQASDARGVLPGTILLNGAFTEKAMENLLNGPHTVVHIASHFVFQPGDDSRSYLLLAGRDQDTAGYHMTVADFRDDQQLSLDDTDLLTLSACETGMSGSANNGREVDGLGTTAQLKGAKAVISSLWEVNDASTGQLMADFYKRWAEGSGKVSKVEALREAQLDLLHGRVAPQSGVAGRGFGVAENESAGLAAPAGYAHPYYWAPFVLMGNWR